jgi:hypothetical protein
MSTKYFVVTGYEQIIAILTKDFNTVILSWMIIFIFLYYNDMAKYILAKVILKCT